MKVMLVIGNLEDTGVLEDLLTGGTLSPIALNTACV